MNGSGVEQTDAGSNSLHLCTPAGLAVLPFQGDFCFRLAGKGQRPVVLHDRIGLLAAHMADQYIVQVNRRLIEKQRPFQGTTFDPFPGNVHGEDLALIIDMDLFAIQRTERSRRSIRSQRSGAS